MRSRLSVESLEIRDVPATAFQSLPVLPFDNAAVTDHVRAIFARGQQLGRQFGTFARFGDSNSSTYSEYGTVVYPYLNPLGVLGYNPGATNLAATHPELLTTWKVYHDTLNASGQNSFAWIGPGAWGGWSTANVLAALDSVVATSNPAVVLIMIGTNEIPSTSDISGFRARLSQVVDALVARGIVPVLSTVPDYQGAGGVYEYRVPQVNQLIANVAASDAVPLWNFWRVSTGLANQGIYQDQYQIHLTVSPNGGGSFYPADRFYAQNLRNLEALQVLDWFRTTVTGGPVYVAPNAAWRAMPTSTPVYAVGRDAGFSATVDVYDIAGHRVNRFLAFPATYGSGVRVATGDVNGDGFTDVVCATNGEIAARVKVFSGRDGTVLAKWVPFGRGYTGAVSVAVGDVNGDSVADVAVGKLDGTSGVRAYAGGSLNQLGAFRAFPRMTGGASVAIANVTGLGEVVAVGNTDSPIVRLFDAGGSLLSSLRVFGGSGVGVTVAAADLNGDGTDELAVTRSIGSNRVHVLDAVTHAQLTTLTVGPLADANYGLRLGTLHHSSGTDTLLVGSAPGSAVSLRGFDDLTGTTTKLAPTNANRAYGIFVG